MAAPFLFPLTFSRFFPPFPFRTRSNKVPAIPDKEIVPPPLHLSHYSALSQRVTNDHHVLFFSIPHIRKFPHRFNSPVLSRVPPPKADPLLFLFISSELALSPPFFSIYFLLPFFFVLYLSPRRNSRVVRNFWFSQCRLQLVSPLRF